EVVIDDEIHQRVEDKSGALAQQLGLALATSADVGVRQGGPVTNRHHVPRSDEDMGLAELDPFAIELRRAEHDEQRLAILFELRALMGAQGVLDCEVVETELSLNLPKQLLGGLMKTDPDKLPFVLQHLADGVDLDVADLAPVGVGGTV